MAQNHVNVRLAPSPTGFLHIGTAQSALYNWLFAKKNGGEFHLRIEDTDKERSTKAYEQSILEALQWLGLAWDGGVVHQSERTAIYQAGLEQLLDSGKAFYCHHSQEELEAERKQQEAAKEPPRHICDYKNSEKGKEAGGIIRLAVQDTTVSFADVIRGPIEFKAALLGDFSIARSIDDALYNFAVVMDDSEMAITTVIRGEDHISNTPKQILIYEALGKPVPQFAHLPLLLAPDRSKLSKRHGAIAVVEFKKDYLLEAVINFLGTLSYTFSKEIISKEEMIAEFDLAKVHKSGAVFDIQKLNWLNAQYIRRLAPADFSAALKSAGHDFADQIPAAAVPLITERLEKLTAAGQFSYLWEMPQYDSKLLLWKTSSSADVKTSLEAVAQCLRGVAWQKESMLAALEALAAEKGNKGIVFWPLRVALSGRDKSPDPIDIALVLGQEESLKRIQHAISSLA